MNENYKFIETENELVEICNSFRGSSWLAIDTEFEREKTFYPELCLVQIANEELVAVIDPIRIDNLQAMFDLLFDVSITKVFHAARQDLEIFFMLQGEIPQPLFDTQIAAPLVGYDEQIGYGNLVSKMLQVSLSKAHTRTDWKRRPLQSAQLDYAADDVIYLGKVYKLLKTKLEQHGRVGWLEEDFSALCEPALYQPDPSTVWKKIRSGKKLKGSKLSAFQHLAAWREITARAENRPKNWLVRDDALVDLSQILPKDISDLKRIKGLNEKLINKYGKEIVKIIVAAQQQEPLAISKEKQRSALSPVEEVKVDALCALVRLLAKENNLNPNTLAPRKELEKFVQHDSNTTLSKGWREHLIGKELKSFLDGEVSLQVIDDVVVFKKM